MVISTNVEQDNWTYCNFIELNQYVKESGIVTEEAGEEAGEQETPQQPSEEISEDSSDDAGDGQDDTTI